MDSERGKASLHSPNWSSLPEELIPAILVRLPVKNLLQLKCVSKDWLRLISSPHFVKSHLHVSAKEYRLLLYNSIVPQFKHYSVTSLFDDHNPFYLDIPVDERHEYPHSRIVGSVNGLICFDNGSTKGFVLWNPLTRKFKKVPAPTKPCGFAYGFGYDEVYDDYKLVGIDAILRSTPLCATVYSLRSDSWRELDFQGRVTRCKSAKLVNRKLHWATGSSDSDDWSIMSFDLVDEKFGEVVQPSYKEGRNNLYLGVLGSDLSMLYNYMRSADEITRSDVWVLKEYGVKESWTKLYTIKYPDTYPDNWMQYVHSPPICMSSKGASLFLNGATLSIYNPEYETFTEVTEVYGHLQAELYTESLVCPISQNEPMQQH